MAIRCKLIDFVISETDQFKIQMFGINDKRETFSITVYDFKPFVYIKVGSSWSKSKCDEFIEHLKGLSDFKYVANHIVSYELVQRKKLYGFDGGKYYNFICIYCKNMSFIHKLKTLYYDKETQEINRGYLFDSVFTTIYECHIPPLLRFFHIQKISPSGWVRIENYRNTSKQTTCDYEIICKFKDVISIDDDTLVPYKICSFDIEASSSHGDFPEAIKNYKKVAYDIVYYILNNNVVKDDIEYIVKELLLNVFSYKDSLQIDKCYMKHAYTEEEFEMNYKEFVNSELRYSRKMESKLKSYFEDDGDLKIKQASNSNIISLLSSDTDLPTQMAYLLDLLDINFPELKGDEVTFIGSSFINYGEEEPYLQHCICIADTAQVKEGQVIECYSSEKDILCAWTALIQREDPDIIIGYNIFGFDYKFMFERSTENDCVDEFMKLGRTETYSRELQEQSIVLASGPYDLKWITMTGRLQIDLYTYMRKEFTLGSYKLDFVASIMLSDSVKKYVNHDNRCDIYTKNMKGVEIDGFVHFEIINNSSELYEDGAKFKVVAFHDQGFTIENNINCKDKMNWGLAKDDISPRDIFEMTKQGPQEKGIIAKYCIQDCNLVHKLFQKIDVMTSFIEMAKLCSVPIQFLVLRGQTIKLTSYMALKCREKDVLMPLISKGGGEESLEGANVLDPKCGLYLEDPVACLDYSSLYPTCSITNNICMSSLVWRKTFDLKGKLIKVKGIQNEKSEFIYDNLPGYQYVDIPRDDYEPGTKNVIGKIVCRWAQYPGDDKAIFPSILEELLKSRKATKKQMEKEVDPFKKNILEKRQLSIKITANSLYGQSGSKISSFYDIDVAASITASGRILLDYAKTMIETVYQGPVDTKYGVMNTAAEYVYGDTDSVFFKFNFTKDGKKLDGKMALELTIELAQKAGELATSFLKKPHDLEYEKTFMPFCLLSKKRYVGMLYELDINSCKRKSMGIVLKRRDNANIVKDVYGGIIDILMKENDIEKAIAFLKSSLDDIVHEKVPVEKLIISKSIRSFYKNPKQIAHNVLSERIGVRDPGNKPAPGDRIPYIYIDNGSKLQGDKIETPSFIKERNLKIDYGYYITNQIMNPVLQLFSLVLYDMKEFKRRKVSFIQELSTYKETLESEKYAKKEQTLKDKEVEKILFEPYLRINKNKKTNTKAITSFFKS